MLHIQDVPPKLSIMIPVLVLVLLLNSCQTHAAPLNTLFEAVGVNQDDASSVPAMRTLSSIVYTCFTTTLACTWVAAHPNIPYNNRKCVSTIVRIMLALCALVVPEVIAFWAAIQWRAANEYTTYFKNFSATKNWTITHGFFLAMGGFTIPYYTTSESIVLHRTLPAKEFKYLLKKNLITIPHIREADLLDKDKGDALAKTFAMLQTLWFALQILARFQQNLIITKLEVITLALVPLNVATYFFWWNKPLGVRLAIPLQWKLENGQEPPSIADMKKQITSALANDVELAPKVEDPPGSSNLASAEPKSPPSPKPDDNHELVNPDDNHETVNPDKIREKYDKKKSWYSIIFKDEPDQYHLDAFSGTATIDEPQDSKASWWQKCYKALEISHILVQVPLETPENGHIDSTLTSNRVLDDILAGVALIVGIPAGLAFGAIIFALGLGLAALLVALLLSLVLIFGTIGLCIEIALSPWIVTKAFRAIGHETDTLSGKHRKLRIFYAPALEFETSYNLMIIVSVFLATVFGSLHVLAWNFQFPSPAEHLLWRISCIVLAGLPLLFLFCYAITFYVIGRGKEVFDGFICVGSFAYALARLYVLVGSVLALRSPIPGTLTAVQWNSFIPHI